MTYIEFLIRAKNQYNLHSPYVFNLYQQVLNTRLQRDKIGIVLSGKQHRIIYKIANTFRPHNVYIGTTAPSHIATIVAHATQHNVTIVSTPTLHTIDLAIINNIEEWKQISEYIGPQSIVLWLQPHKNSLAESQFATFVADNKVKVSLDMYHTAIAVFLPQLHKEHYMLR